MNYQIRQTNFKEERRQYIFRAFHQHALESMGMDGLGTEPQAFELYLGGEFVGCVVIQLFWGQLWIKYVLIEVNYRGRGYGKRLMEHALAYGKAQGCRFAFVETLSIQAPGFYQKFGFEVELKRDGFEGGVSFYYLKKDL